MRIIGSRESSEMQTIDDRPLINSLLLKCIAINRKLSWDDRALISRFRKIRNSALSSKQQRKSEWSTSTCTRPCTCGWCWFASIVFGLLWKFATYVVHGATVTSPISAYSRMSTAAEVFSYVPTYLPGWTGWWWSSAAAEEKEWLLAPTKKLSMVRVLWPQQRLTLIRSMFFRPGRSFFIHGWHGVVSMLVFYTLVFLTFFFFIWANAFRISSSLAVLVGDFFACGWVWLGWSTEGRVGEDITRHR